MQTWKIATAVLAGCLVSAASTQAASYTHPGPFVTDGGVYSDITETSITDAVPLFGSPTIMPNNLLLFEMTNYNATANDNSSDVTHGTLEFTFESDPGEYIQTIILSESGTYSVVGDGSASAAGTLTIQYYDDVAGEFVILADPIQMSLFPETSFPVENESDGTWAGVALIDLQKHLVSRPHRSSLLWTTT